MALRLASRSAAVARSLVPRASVPVKIFKTFSVQDRSFQSSKPAFAKEYTGVGLETDPTRGVRIDLEAYMSFPGKPRSSEYDNVLEQDPLGDKEGSGGNDDIFGEWGLDRDAPHISTEKALLMFTIAMSCLGGFYTMTKSYAAGIVNPAAPREGLWNMDNAAKH
mmetsp:Transcript_53184/g.110932  ORF Transcript_53184/g.110932 Transcript_53184/m.110932 type:complete len:164 (-) Transcript_53184:363-854(-)